MSNVKINVQFYTRNPTNNAHGFCLPELSKLI